MCVCVYLDKKYFEKAFDGRNYLYRVEDDSTGGRFAMERYEEEAEDSDNETDPEQLLNEWLGELDSLTVVSLYFSLACGFTVFLVIYNRERGAQSPPLTTCGQLFMK